SEAISNGISVGISNSLPGRCGTIGPRSGKCGPFAATAVTPAAGAMAVPKGELPGWPGRAEAARPALGVGPFMAIITPDGNPSEGSGAWLPALYEAIR